MHAELDIVLQTEQMDGSFRCRGFSGVPSASRSWIAITSTGSPDGRTAAGALSAEIEAALLGSSPEVRAADVPGGASPAAMAPSAEADRLKLLVLIGDTTCKFRNEAWYHNWESDQNRSGVMILLPPGKYEDFFDQSLQGDDQAEHLLRRINTVGWSEQAKSRPQKPRSWPEKMREVLPSVLGRAEVTSPINRIFISYRRLETLPLALQLFDRLSHERFEVFLDRFSIEPGVDFQRRLTQELEEKSMVVLLESAGLKTSKWTQHEIDFAKRRRLGLIALRMPDVEDLLTSVDARESLECKDFEKQPVEVEVNGEKVRQWQELSGEKLDDVIAKIKQAHADALYRRRYRLRKDIVSAFSDQGMIVVYQSVGAMKVVRGSDHHVLWPTTRPPQVDDFRSVHGAFHAGAPPTIASCAIIVGPLVALEPDRQEELEWLHKVSQCRTFDEGNLAQLACQVASGDWM